MNTFRTVLSFPPADFEITHKDKILSIGSCFAENMGTKLKDRKFQLISNPFGILYHPLSITKCLDTLQIGKKYQPDQLLKHGDIWYSFDHHSEFSSKDKSSTLKKINLRLEAGHQQLLDSQILIITLGTAFAYFQKSNNQSVANCHKLPSTQFEKKLLSVETIQTAFRPTIQKLLEHNPDIKIIFTVSPIRHFKDGMLNNQVSKASLRLAIDGLTKMFDAAYYFPSYELMLDDLRDYRFYEADMLHPNDTAIQYIWEWFSNTFFSQSTKGNIKKFEQLQKAFLHRPFHPNTLSHQAFLKKYEMLTLQYQQAFPHLNFEKEITYFSH